MAETDRIIELIKSGDNETLRHLLSSPIEPIVLNPECEEYAESPLIQSIYHNNHEAARLLLDAGADPRLQTPFDPGFEPLLLAAQYGRREILYLVWNLLGPEGRYNKRDRRNQVCCLQVAARNGHTDLVSYLLDLWDGWTSTEKSRALREASTYWLDDTVSALLSKIDYEPDDLNDALASAVEKRYDYTDDGWRQTTSWSEKDYEAQERLVGSLIDAGGDPNHLAPGEHPLLHRATACPESIGAVRALLKHGVDPDCRNRDGLTVFHFRYQRGPTRIGQTDRPYVPGFGSVQLLLEHGASPDLVTSAAGETPLHRAAYTADLKLFHLLLSKHARPRDALSAADNAGQTLLHFAAAGGSTDVIEYLLSRGGLEVNARSVNNWTPFVCALAPVGWKSKERALQAARMLLRAGAHPGTSTAEGWTALHCLAAYPDVSRGTIDADVCQLAEELISQGANVEARATAVDTRWGSPLVTGQQLWGVSVQNAILEILSEPSLGDRRDVVRSDTSPVHWAAMIGAMSVLRVLIAHGASVQAIDSTGASSARLASESNRFKYSYKDHFRAEFVDLLLEKGSGY